MNQGKHFCTNCGQPIDEGARFCANCGAEIAPANVQQNAPPPVYQPPPVYPAPNYQPPPAYNAPPTYAPPPAAAPGYQSPVTGIPGEGLIGVIPNASRKKGLIAMEVFNIIVTKQRMVFALMTSQMIKDAAASHRGEGVGGFFQAMGSGYTLWERYLQMPSEQALHENPNNFAVF